MTDTSSTGTSPEFDSDTASVPAVQPADVESFQLALNRYVSRRIRDSLANLVSPENSLHLKHGQSWGNDSAEPGSEGVLKRSSAELTVSRESILRNDLNAFRAFLDTMCESMSGQMRTEIYSTVSEAADAVGNTVSGKEAGSLAAAFLEMLRKIEFGVDASGQVTLPSIHVSPEMGKKMFEELSAQGPEFHQEVERLKQDKATAALQKESMRLGRYRTP